MGSFVGMERDTPIGRCFFSLNGTERQFKIDFDRRPNLRDPQSIDEINQKVRHVVIKALADILTEKLFSTMKHPEPYDKNYLPTDWRY